MLIASRQGEYDFVLDPGEPSGSSVVERICAEARSACLARRPSLDSEKFSGSVVYEQSELIGSSLGTDQSGDSPDTAFVAGAKDGVGVAHQLSARVDRQGVAQCRFGSVERALGAMASENGSTGRVRSRASSPGTCGRLCESDGMGGGGGVSSSDTRSGGRLLCIDEETDAELARWQSLGGPTDDIV